MCLPLRTRSTALQWAAYYGYKELVVLLLTRGADIELKDAVCPSPPSFAFPQSFEGK